MKRFPSEWNHDFQQNGFLISNVRTGDGFQSGLFNISSANKIYLVTGYTDMRKSIDGLMAIIRDTYSMDPFGNAVFLFCGRRCDRIKALHYEKDGFCLLYKRLNQDQGKFQWPRNREEVRDLTRQEFRWLLEGLSIEQPKAIRPSGRKAF